MNEITTDLEEQAKVFEMMHPKEAKLIKQFRTKNVPLSWIRKPLFHAIGWMSLIISPDAVDFVKHEYEILPEMEVIEEGEEGNEQFRVHTMASKNPHFYFSWQESRLSDDKEWKFDDSYSNRLIKVADRKIKEFQKPFNEIKNLPALK